MPRYYDSEEKPHVLAKEIGRGGEGTVYFCEGNAELVAKIYHEPISDEKAKKLQLMAENKNERLLKVAAWVVETLHEKPRGKVVGFLMPRIKAKEIHELYSLKSRRRYFPQATWHYLIHTATNLARAFYSLHKYKHVIGDVNHGNCVVLADGTVKLIDCDSYAISDGKKRFACKVGVATHLAPELQKANLSEIDRKPEHDNFALAVVIFQLLFLGRHPFAGNYLGEKDKTLEDCISEFRFAYGKHAKKFNVRRPPGTLNLGEVSPRVTELFERAFDEKMMNRPSPREWIEALVDLSEKLTQCSLNPGHRFYTELSACPWCRIESQTGLMLFPFVFNEEHTNGESAFNIFTVEQLIDRLVTQRNLPAKLEKPRSLVLPEPKQEIVQNAMMNRNHQLLFVGGYFITLVILSMVFGLVIGTILGVFLMIYLFTKLSGDNRELQSNLLNALSEAENEWQNLEKDFTINSSPKMFAGDLKIIRDKVKDYKNLQLSTGKDLKSIEDGTQHRHFIDYLRSFRLAESNIPGIGEKARQDLVEKKVWTAAEIDEKRLRKDYGVNVYLTKNLIKWRKELEQNYSDKVNPEQIAVKEDILESKTDIRKQIERSIEISLESLQKRKVKARQVHKTLVPKSKEIAKKVLQSKSNLQAVGDTSVALAMLILITVLVPFVGGIISEVISQSDVGVNYGSDKSSVTSPTPYSAGGEIVETDSKVSSYTYGGERLSFEQADSLLVPNKKISDKEISNLSDSLRKTYSDNLVRQAIHYAKSVGENPNINDIKLLDDADEKVELAMRVKKDNIIAFEEFGVTLYDSKHYPKSLEYFEKLEKVTKFKSNLSQMYIGMNSLRLRQFGDARNAFLFVTKNDGASEPFYNLGLSYKGLKEYRLAKNAFKSALTFNPGDSDTLYELGYAYFKLNEKEGFNEQYAILLDLNKEKAAELLKNSYKLPPKNLKKEEDTEVDLAPGSAVGFGTGTGSGNGSGVGSESGSGEGRTIAAPKKK